MNKNILLFNKSKNGKYKIYIINKIFILNIEIILIEKKIGKKNEAKSTNSKLD